MIFFYFDKELNIDLKFLVNLHTLFAYIKKKTTILFQQQDVREIFLGTL